MDSEKAVLVTTEYRGVFFGYVPNDADFTVSTIKLERARLCIYWSTEIKGFMGLAVTGPNMNCKIGPAAKSINLQKITAILECTDDAIKAWESAPWK